MKIYMMRHGLTDWNQQRRLQGSSDIPLNQIGLDMAGRAAEAFFTGRFPVQRLYCSHLCRSRQTADILARRLGLVPQVAEGLEEVDLGDWEGLTFAQVQERFPEAYARWRGDPIMVPPNGESIFETGQRGMRTVKRLAREGEGDFAAVSHGGLIRSMLCQLIGAPPEKLDEYEVPNCGVALFEYDPQADSLRYVEMYSAEEDPGKYKIV